MITTRFLLSLLFFGFSLSLFIPKILAQEETVATSSTSPVSSYELFWPISAGKVMGDQLYSLKILKENLRGIFVFSNLKKAEYNMTLSEKRVVEAEELFLNKKDYTNGGKTLEESFEKKEKAVDFLKKESDQKGYADDVRTRMLRSFINQKDLLNSIKAQVPQEQKATLEDNIIRLNLLLKSLE